MVIEAGTVFEEKHRYEKGYTRKGYCGLQIASAFIY